MNLNGAKSVVFSQVLGIYPSTIRRRILRHLYLQVLATHLLTTVMDCWPPCCEPLSSLFPWFGPCMQVLTRSVAMQYTRAMLFFISRELTVPTLLCCPMFGSHNKY